jgi:hypothetical protein
LELLLQHATGQPPSALGEQSNGQQEQVRQDRWVVWPALAPFAGLFIATYFSEVFLLPIFLAGYIIFFAGILALISAATYVAGKRWKSAVSCFALPIIVLLVVGFPHTFIPPVIAVGDHVRLFVNQHSYEARINSLKERKGARHHVFDWGGGSV